MAQTNSERLEVLSTVAQQVYQFATFIFNIVQWTLASGLLYYAISKIDAKIAQPIAIILNTVIVLPMMYFVLPKIASLFFIKNAWGALLFTILLSIVLSRILTPYMLDFVKTVASSQGAS